VDVPLTSYSEPTQDRWDATWIDDEIPAAPSDVRVLSEVSPHPIQFRDSIFHPPRASA
jgi:hypothetical protein